MHNSQRYSFCPKCGAALEARVLKASEPRRLVCTGCEFVFFLDPKVATGCIIEQDGAIVLLRRAIEPALGKWVFPGGYVDLNERVEDAAIRETVEESRLVVRVTSLLGVYSYTGRPIVVIVFVGEITGGYLAAADETLEARTFRPAEIPWNALAFPSTFDALADYLRRYHDLTPPKGATAPRITGT